MKQNTQRNIINASSLATTTITGVLGVITGIPAIQAAAYLPPIVQTVFLEKFNLKNKIIKELDEDLKELILKTCNITKNQLRQKNNSIADFFGYTCTKIESELTKNFSINNIDIYFEKYIRQNIKWEGIYLTDKDLLELIDLFVDIFVINLLNYPKLADYLYTLVILNHEQRIRNIEKNIENDLDKPTDSGFICYDDTIIYCNKYEEILFLHKNIDSQNAITLKDIFTMPSCILNKGNFNDISLAINNFINYQSHEPGYDNTNILFIEGQAAMGKSSLISWLAWQFCNQTKISKDIFGDKKLKIIKLRDLLIEDTKLDLQAPFKNIFNYILGKDICQLLDNTHTDILKMFLENTILILDGFDELCMVENILGKGKEVFFLNMYRQLIKANCGCKVIITTRPNYLKIDSLDFPKWHIQINPFLIKQRRKWIEKYEIKTKLPLNIKDSLLSNHDITIECLIETPLMLYMIAAKKISIYETKNIWELYHKIFAQEIYNRNYDKEGPHSIQKYQRNLYALTAEIAYAISNEQHFFITIEKLLEIEQVKDLAKKLDVLEQDENINYEKLHIILADCIGIASYFKISTKKDKLGKYKNAIEFYHNNIKDYFCCEYIWINLQRIYRNIPSDVFQLEHWFMSNFQNMFQFSVFMKDNSYSSEPSMVIQFFKSKLLHYKEKSFNENFISQELENCYFKHFFGKMLQTGIICEYTYSGNKNILNMMANIFASVFSIYHSIYITYLKDDELIVFTKEKYITDISVSFIFRILFPMANIHNQSHVKFDDIMLSGITFGKRNFSFSSFKNCLLIECNFQECDLRGTDFRYANLQGADLRNALIDNNTRFEHAKFSQTLISKKQLSYINCEEKDGLLISEE